MNLLDKISRENVKEDVADFNVGDTVKVNVKITEGTNNDFEIKSLFLLNTVES